MKKFVICLLALLTINISVFAETEFSDPKDCTQYKAGHYKVGTDIPAGKYVVYSSAYNRDVHGYVFETTDANGNDYVQSASFYYETIIEKKKKEKIAFN